MSKRKKKKMKKHIEYSIVACMEDGCDTISNSSPCLDSTIATAADRHKEYILDIKKETGMDILFMAILPTKVTEDPGFRPSDYIDTVKTVVFANLNPDNPDNNDNFLIMKGKDCGFIFPIVGMTAQAEEA